mgnify:CR=1 FL=1
MNKKFGKGDLVKYNIKQTIPISIEDAIEEGYIGIVYGYDQYGNVVVEFKDMITLLTLNQKFLKKVK